jgi:hypothetical protein
LVVTIGVLVATRYLLIGVLSGQPRIDVMAGRSNASFRWSDLLVLAVFGDVVTYVLLSVDASGLRYLVPGVIFASILGAMYLGHFVNEISNRRVQHVIAAFALLVVGCCASCVGFVLTESVPTSPYSEVSTFLADHHLYKGVGDYWTSAPISVDSDGQVVVRQVLLSFTGGLTPYLNLAKSTWYTGKFQFLICNLDESSNGVRQYYGQQLLDASKFPFSQVAHTYDYLSFRIVVWKSPVTIADLENNVPRAAGYAGITGQALPGLPESNWPKLSAQPADELPLFASAGQTTSSNGLAGHYEVSIYNFYSRSTETAFYGNPDLALSDVITDGAAIAPLVGSTGVRGVSEGFDLSECGGSSSVEPDDKCSGRARKPYSVGVITVFERGPTVTVITYRPNDEQNPADPHAELAKNVKVANSVTSLLATAGIS